MEMVEGIEQPGTLLATEIGTAQVLVHDRTEIEVSIGSTRINGVEYRVRGHLEPSRQGPWSFYGGHCSDLSVLRREGWDSGTDAARRRVREVLEAAINTWVAAHPEVLAQGEVYACACAVRLARDVVAVAEHKADEARVCLNEAKQQLQDTLHRLATEVAAVTA